MHFSLIICLHVFWKVMYDVIGYFARQGADAEKFYRRLFWVLLVWLLAALYNNSRISFQVALRLQGLHVCQASYFLFFPSSFCAYQFTKYVRLYIATACAQFCQIPRFSRCILFFGMRIHVFSCRFPHAAEIDLAASIGASCILVAFLVELVSRVHHFKHTTR